MEKGLSHQAELSGKAIFRWEFAEFPKYERNRNWYIASAVAVVFFLLFSIIAKNFLFGIIVIIGALIVAMFQRSNNTVSFAITEDGIQVNSKAYTYKELKNFFIIYNPPEVKTLYFEPKSIFSPRIPISLENQDPVAIRAFLAKRLPEDIEREDEPLSDQTSRMFKL